MTYKQQITQELRELWIYNWLEYERWNILLKEGFYISKELIKFLKYNEPVKITSNNIEIFRSYLEVTKHTVRNNVINRKYLYLKWGYYNKNKFIKYIIERI